MISLHVLINELWADSKLSDRCPHISKEDDKCICNSPKTKTDFRYPPSHFDLQLWCLGGKERYAFCIFHPEYGIEHAHETNE